MTGIVDKAVLIDDSDIDLFIQRRFLEVYNFSNQLFIYTSAVSALEWLRKLNEQDAPNLVFLDLNMPDMDGFGFLEKFKDLNQEIKKKIKIVILTSSNDAKEKKQALASEGVIHFITKPLKKTDLEEVKRLMEFPSTV